MTLTLLIYCLYHCPSHYCKEPVCQFGHFNCLCIALHCKWRFLHCRALAHDAWTWYCEEHTLTKYGTTYCIPYYAIGSLMKQYNKWWNFVKICNCNFHKKCRCFSANKIEDCRYAVSSLTVMMLSGRLLLVVMCMLDNSSLPATCTAANRRCPWPVTKDTSSRRMLSTQLHQSRLSAACDTYVTVVS